LPLGHRGALIVLKTEDEHWLRDSYPGLTLDGKSVSGHVKFNATYNREFNRFLILADGVIDTVGGLALSGEFRIRIKERADKTASALPAVYVEEVDVVPERHFNPADRSACLCSSLEETDFFQPEFQFRLFLEQLVVPFLYGQISYSQTGRWPWSEYAHGAIGLLESYSDIADRSKAEDCLRRLAHDRNVWPSIKAALQQKPYIKGHTPCFCPKMDKIRRCHPKALRGVLELQRDIRVSGIPIPV
jgi:hypothetical protein